MLSQHRENKIFFILGDKLFELIAISEDNGRWFLWIEQGSRLTSKIKIYGENIRWVCEQMLQASQGAGNIYRRWGSRIQGYLYMVYQNYNIYGSFIRFETWFGDKKSAIIILEIDCNKGCGDITRKILLSWERPLITGSKRLQICKIGLFKWRQESFNGPHSWTNSR